MLVRSAGRRHERRTSTILAASFAQLNLPWLAPAQLRWSASQASLPSQRPRRRCASKSAQAQAHVRSLATAADPHALRQHTAFPPTGYSIGFRNSLQDKHIPWEHDRAPLFQTNDRNPVVLDTPPESSKNIIRVPSRGLAGPVRQLLSQLYTSLGVGRRDRAANIVQRLTDHCGPTSPEAVHAHNVYLEELFKSLASYGRDSPKSQEALKEMARWFEVEIHNKGVSFDARMLITVIRGAIRSLTGSKRERSIRRYVELSQQLGTKGMEEVLESEDYDDNEYVILTQATEEYQELAERESLLEEEEEGVPQVEELTPEGISSADAKTAEPIPEPLPDVLPTGQKGAGLAGIKRTMESFLQLPTPAPNASDEEKRLIALEKQRLVEETATDVAIERWRRADEDLRKIGIHTSMQSKPVAALMWEWYRALLPALEQELVEVKKVLAKPTTLNAKTEADRHEYGPYLELLSIEKIAATTILHVMSKLNSGKNRATNEFEAQDVKLTALAASLASALHAECTVDYSAKKSKDKSGPKRAAKNKTSTSTKGKKSKRNQDNEALLAQMEWSSVTRVKLGAMLLSKLIETSELPVTKTHPRTRERITQMQPAFLHRVKYSRGKKQGLCVPNPALIDKIQSEPLGSLLAKRMPMVVEPKPWKGWSDGGFMHYPTSIMRLPVGDRSGKDYFEAADENSELDTVYRGLTALGKVPWKVNKDVFKVQLEAWNSGEAVANFAPLNPTFNHPPEPDSASDPGARRKWLQDVQEIENRRSGLHSERCFQNFQMEVARTMYNETMYFPHNMDFRGRAYPIPPYLNHMGADNVRGLLTFGEGKPLGETGLRWLKIHLATVAGHDKASMEERVEYTESHLDDIYDSVRNPLDGRRWWLEAEDAWQLLAACFELTKALDSPDPTAFVSSLPVQQDGTCNGLQHYAALGGDKAGAAQVNLEPGDRPADVYTAVAEAVKEEVRIDAANGDPVAQKLHGRITRKCVKQPVMTNVYGVTFFGARLQVKKQLEVLFPEVNRHDAVNLSVMAHYIALKIFKSLGTMFAGAQAIQAWLGKCADRISTCLTPEQIQEVMARGTSAKDVTKGSRASTSRAKKDKSEDATDADDAEDPPKKKKSSKPTKNQEQAQLQAVKNMFRSTVVWTTPLRLPVVQPYRNSQSRLVRTSMQNMSIVEPQVWDPVSKRKQLQAFPPNFIHSLDATHMLLSSLKCSENGITFASIHDSFWTHACDVNNMSVVLRDAFVAMHEEDIIGRLREEFQTRYQGHMYLASVLAQSRVGKKVIKQRESMKKDPQRISELALEEQRMRLCNSEDPEERAKGEAMVTPGSIVASEADESAFAGPSEMEGQTLGEMPGSIEEIASTNTDTEASEIVNEDPDADTEVVDAESESEMEASADEMTSEESSKVKAAKKQGTTATMAKKKTSPAPPRKIFVWLPLTFPEVPQKGEFDVKRLRESRYFFH